MIEDIFQTKPDFVNEKGVKWWIDKSTTGYAQRPDVRGTKLAATCFFVEELDGHRTRVLISDTHDIIAEDQSLEGMGCKIDVIKALKRFTNRK